MIKYGYFVIPGNKTRYAVAAVKKIENTNPNNADFQVAFAFCSANDHFSKKIGRSIASGRLNSEKVFIVSFDKNDWFCTSDILNIALDFASNNKEKTIPSWFTRAHKNKKLLWGLKSLSKTLAVS